MCRLGLTQRPHALHELQAAAAVGQMGLVQAYESRFSAHDMHTAQILLTHDDLSNRERYLNARSTIRTLLDMGVIPIINENDTVATDEIQFGDNDKLAALTAALIKADLVIIATNTNGIYTKQSMETQLKKTINEVTDIDDLRREISTGMSSQGTGGMQSKIEAAEILKKEKIETWIVNGIQDNFIINAMNQQVNFTRILNDQ